VTTLGALEIDPTIVETVAGMIGHWRLAFHLHDFEAEAVCSVRPMVFVIVRKHKRLHSLARKSNGSEFFKHQRVSELCILSGTFFFKTRKL
jgi:hypothetical protein